MKIGDRVEVLVGKDSRIDWLPGVVRCFCLEPGRYGVQLDTGKWFYNIHESSMRVVVSEAA